MDWLYNPLFYKELEDDDNLFQKSILALSRDLIHDSHFGMQGKPVFLNQRRDYAENMTNTGIQHR